MAVGGAAEDKTQQQSRQLSAQLVRVEAVAWAGGKDVQHHDALQRLRLHEAHWALFLSL